MVPWFKFGDAQGLALLQRVGRIGFGVTVAFRPFIALRRYWRCQSDYRHPAFSKTKVPHGSSTGYYLSRRLMQQVADTMPPSRRHRCIYKIRIPVYLYTLPYLTAAPLCICIRLDTDPPCWNRNGRHTQSKLSSKLPLPLKMYSTSFSGTGTYRTRLGLCPDKPWPLVLNLEHFRDTMQYSKLLHIEACAHIQSCSYNASQIPYLPALGVRAPSPTHERRIADRRSRSGIAPAGRRCSYSVDVRQRQR